MKMDPSQNEFTITLLSNASFDLYPNNTVFKFTNVLAQKLVFPEREDWCVCLRSISIATTSDNPEFELRKQAIQAKINKYKTKLNAAKKEARASKTVEDQLKVQEIENTATSILKDRVSLFNEANTIFVKCAQILPKFGEERIITSFILPPSEARKGEFFTYQPNTDEYFNLSTNEITEFEISVNNTKGQKLYQTAAQPTIIVLKFKKMNTFNKSYTINVSNGDEPPADFYTHFMKLESRDDRQNPWEIAVSRISFIPSFKRFPPGKFNISIAKNADDFIYKFSPSTWDSYLKTKDTGVMSFEYNEGDTNSTMVQFVSQVISNACKKIGLEGKMESRNGKLQISIREKEGEEKEEQKTVLVILPEELIYVLGFDGEGIQYKNGYGAIPTTLKKTIKGKRKMNLNFLIPQNLLLYMDCIAPSLVGNIHGRYLTHIPVPSVEDTSSNKLKLPYISYEPKHLEFHQLLQSDVSNVRIQLLKTDGTTPEFSLDNIKVFITFLIREKQI